MVRNWQSLNLYNMRHVIDAQGQMLGRLASQIAHILQGKNNPAYQPNRSGGTAVVVKNVSKVKVSGKKYSDKIYYKHTGYMGHLKKRTYSQVFEKDPAKVLEMAVYNMLPKNRLRKDRMRKLVIEK